ncbi:MAG: tetratricopeptide repeat protein [Trueperaceae bacterium]
MNIVLIPLIGPFHLRSPAYNVVTVRDTLAVSQPEALATTGLHADDFKNPAWQDTLEPALPHTVIPWAQKQKLPVYGVLERSPDATASNDFKRFANEYPTLNSKMLNVERLLRPVQSLLEQPLNLQRIEHELLPLLYEYQHEREQVFEDGPGTDWLHERVQTMAQRILELPHERVTVLASAEHLPFLKQVLEGKARLEPAPQVETSEESRERSLLDFAFRTDVPEPGNLIAKLREVQKPEARYHEANLLLANGHLAEALDILEAASHTDFSEPYYLPGYLLARLGQLYDLAGNRDAALRAYKGVKALSYAPKDALEAATGGLETPFG